MRVEKEGVSDPVNNFQVDHRNKDHHWSEAWEPNESVKQWQYSFDVVCQSLAIRLVLTSHTVHLCSHLSWLILMW